MKRIILVFVLIIAITGCSSEKYGGSVNKELPRTMIKDILLNPELEGKTVNLEGIIISQCASSGCWFFLKDATGQVLVDLAPHGFTLPPKMGKTVRITGIPEKRQGGMKIAAQGVEIN
ncbi:MAG: hypothetical protein Q7U40_01640 [Desulfatirhabdiaceae bacterium]|nr:hypothetical protein [Desulfatirhabdiaceae bacterium]